MDHAFNKFQIFPYDRTPKQINPYLNNQTIREITLLIEGKFSIQKNIVFVILLCIYVESHTV